MKSKLELAAEEYSKSQPPKDVCVLPIEHSKAFIAGAKHREAELMGVINPVIKSFKKMKRNMHRDNWLELRENLIELQKQLAELGIE